MATQVIYVSKPSVTNSSGQGNPAATGLSYDDTNVSSFPSTAVLLGFLERHDKRGLAYSASSNAGVTFTQSGDKGGL